MRYRRRYSAAAQGVVIDAVPGLSRWQSFTTGAVVVGSAACGVALWQVGGGYIVVAFALWGGALWLGVASIADAADSFISWRSIKPRTAPEPAAPEAPEDDAPEFRQVGEGHLVRVTPEHRRAVAFLTAAIKVVGADATRLPRYDRMGYGRDASRVAIASLRPHLIVNPEGRANGTYCGAAYPTLGELLQAVEDSNVIVQTGGANHEHV